MYFTCFGLSCMNIYNNKQSQNFINNDYCLSMPSNNSTENHKTEDIPFPQVPPEVLQHTAVADQVRNTFSKDSFT